MEIALNAIFLAQNVQVKLNLIVLNANKDLISYQMENVIAVQKIII